MAKGPNNHGDTLVHPDQQNELRRAIKDRQRKHAKPRTTGLTGQLNQKTQPVRWEGERLRGAVAPSVVASLAAQNPSRNNRRGPKQEASASRRMSSDDASRLAQQSTAYRALNPVPDSYDDKIILHFLDQWLKASPVKDEHGKVLQSRSRLAVKAVRGMLPKVEATSKQVSDILAAATQSIRNAAR